MKILCPLCSLEKAQAISITRRDHSALCPQCSRRYRLETFTLKSYQNQSERGGTKYLLKGEKDGIDKNISLLLEKRIPLQRGDIYTLVSRNGIPLGLANQRQNTWSTLFLIHRPWKFLNQLALFLTIPLIILALIQATRLPGFLLDQDPRSYLFLVLLLLPFLIAPAIFWITRETLKGEDRARHIPGYHAEEEDL